MTQPDAEHVVRYKAVADFSELFIQAAAAEARLRALQAEANKSGRTGGGAVNPLTVLQAQRREVDQLTAAEIAHGRAIDETTKKTGAQQRADLTHLQTLQQKEKVAQEELRHRQSMNMLAGDQRTHNATVNDLKTENSLLSQVEQNVSKVAKARSEAEVVASKAAAGRSRGAASELVDEQNIEKAVHATAKARTDAAASASRAESARIRASEAARREERRLATTEEEGRLPVARRAAIPRANILDSVGARLKQQTKEMDKAWDEARREYERRQKQFERDVAKGARDAERAARTSGGGSGGNNVVSGVAKALDDLGDLAGGKLGKLAKMMFSFRGLILLAIATMGPLVAALGSLGAVAIGAANTLAYLGGSVAALPGLFTAAITGIGALTIALIPMLAVFKAWQAQEKLATQGSAQLAAAQHEAAQKVTDAQHAYTDASRAIQNAQYDEQRAQISLNEARKQATRDLEDLRKEVNRASLNEQGAILALRQAQTDYRKTLIDSNATALEREQAAFRVKEAENDLSDVRTKNTRNAQDLAVAERRGVEGSEQVVSARKAVTDASYATQNAQYQLQKSSYDLSVALKEQAAGGQQLYQAYLVLQGAYENLGPKARKVAEWFASQGDAWRALQRDLAEDIFGPVSTRLDELQKLMPVVNDLLGKAATAIGGVVAKGLDMVSSGPWVADFGKIADANATIISNLGDAALYVASGFKDIVIAATPFTEWLTGAIRDIAKNFADWANAARNSGSIVSFLRTTEDRLTAIATITSSLFGLLTSLFFASSDFSGGMLSSIVAITAKWAEWGRTQEASGSSFKNWLDDVKPLLHTVWQLVDQFGIAFGRIAADPRNIQEAERILDALANKVLPPLVGIFGKLSESGVISSLVKDLGWLFSSVERFLNNGGSLFIINFFKDLVWWLGLLVKVISAPGIAQGAGILLGLFATLSAGAVIGRYTGLFKLVDLFARWGGMRGMLRELAAVIGLLFTGHPVEAMSRAVSGLMGGIRNAAGSLRDFGLDVARRQKLGTTGKARREGAVLEETGLGVPGLSTTPENTLAMAAVKLNEAAAALQLAARALQGAATGQEAAAEGGVVEDIAAGTGAGGGGGVGPLPAGRTRRKTTPPAAAAEEAATQEQAGGRMRQFLRRFMGDDTGGMIGAEAPMFGGLLSRLGGGFRRAGSAIGNSDLALQWRAMSQRATGGIGGLFSRLGGPDTARDALTESMVRNSLSRLGGSAVGAERLRRASSTLPGFSGIAAATAPLAPIADRVGQLGDFAARVGRGFTDLLGNLGQFTRRFIRDDRGAIDTSVPMRGTGPGRIRLTRENPVVRIPIGPTPPVEPEVEDRSGWFSTRYRAPRPVGGGLSLERNTPVPGMPSDPTKAYRMMGAEGYEDFLRSGLIRPPEGSQYAGSYYAKGTTSSRYWRRSDPADYAVELHDTSGIKHGQEPWTPATKIGGYGATQRPSTAAEVSIYRINNKTGEVEQVHSPEMAAAARTRGIAMPAPGAAGRASTRDVINDVTDSGALSRLRSFVGQLFQGDTGWIATAVTAVSRAAGTVGGAAGRGLPDTSRIGQGFNGLLSRLGGIATRIGTGFSGLLGKLTGTGGIGDILLQLRAVGSRVGTGLDGLIGRMTGSGGISDLMTQFRALATNVGSGLNGVIGKLTGSGGIGDLMTQFKALGSRIGDGFSGMVGKLGGLFDRPAKNMDDAAKKFKDAADDQKSAVGDMKEAAQGQKAAATEQKVAATEQGVAAKEELTAATEEEAAAGEQVAAGGTQVLGGVLPRGKAKAVPKGAALVEGETGAAEGGGLLAGLGPALIALAATQFIGSTYGKPVNVDPNQVSSGLADYGKTGKAGGQLGGMFGDKKTNLNYDLGTLQDTPGAIAGNALAGGIETITGLGDVADKSSKKANERLDALDQGLADLVKGGNVKEAQKAFDQLTVAAQKQGTTIAQLRDRMKNYQDALWAYTLQQADLHKHMSVYGADLVHIAYLNETLRDKTATSQQTLDAFNKALNDISQDGALHASEKLGQYQYILDSINTSNLTAADKAKAFGTALNNVASDVSMGDTEKLKTYQTAIDDIATSSIDAESKAGLFKTALDNIQATAGDTQTKADALKDAFWRIADAEIGAQQKAQLLDDAWQQLHKPALDLQDAQQQMATSEDQLADSSKKVITGYDKKRKAFTGNFDLIKQSAEASRQLMLNEISSGQETAEQAKKEHDDRLTNIYNESNASDEAKGKLRDYLDEYKAPAQTRQDSVEIQGIDKALSDMESLIVAEYVRAHATDPNVLVDAYRFAATVLKTSKAFSDYLAVEQQQGKTSASPEAQYGNTSSGVGPAPKLPTLKPGSPFAKQSGGVIDGSFDGRVDTVPLLATIGEFITRKRVVDKPYGKDILHALNNEQIDPANLYAALNANASAAVPALNVRPASAASVVNNTNTRNGGLNLGDITINNPVRERSERSMRRALHRLAYLHDK